MADSSRGTSPASVKFRNWLGQRNNEELAAILRHRPDVVSPLPPGIAPLAVRLQLRTSVSRALRTLNATELAVLEAAAALGAELRPVAAAEISTSLATPHGITSQQVTAALEACAACALAFTHTDGDDDTPEGWMVAAEVMAALPTGWSLLEQSTVSAAAFAQLPDAQRAVLDTLATAGGLGTTRDARPDADPARPVPQLIAAGFLHRVDSLTVRLPRAVRQLLRGEHPTAIPLVPPRTLPAGDSLDPNIQQHLPQEQQQEQTQEEVATAGAAAGLETVRQVAQLIDALGNAPLPLLKDKTVGVRAVSQLAKQLGTDEDTIKFLVSLAVAARLLSRGEPTGGSEPVAEGNYLCPTQAGWDWMDAELDARWATVLQAALNSSWRPRADHRLLSEDTASPYQAARRAAVWEVYLQVHSAGTADTTEANVARKPLTPEEHAEAFRYLHPLLASSLPQADVDFYRQEAALVGALAKDTATSMLRHLLDHDEEALTAATAAVTPTPVEQVIVQADMTMLAPGPLTQPARKAVELFADVESPGLAAVYRITPASIRRAYDAGRSVTEIRTWLAEHAIGEVPQAVDYALDDVARHHGSLRGGPALSYLRSDDEALLAQAVSAINDAGVLRLIAPTVAISTTRLGTLLARLREAGLSPTAEDDNGAFIDVSATPYVLPTPAKGYTRAPRSSRAHPKAQPSDDRWLAAAARIREAANTPDAPRRQGTPSNSTPPVTELLATLQAAARAGQVVTVGYTDKNGTPRQINVKPLSATGGVVDAVRADSGQPVRFPVHRISQVSQI
ncbi:helicase-associated domain-containing protein [Corynebacterium incognita]|uniref:Helicase-associated domain-containing protein n=1 Tax=Corynebacterium incognita TaxID=2754725 RepID=A0A7G7CNI0_9CORY|nr:helicase-associated domain-containing protein [Corynebacterium incognita]QNE89146.1 helicase-associated domain-containing protein [Corynebacterium incognita]